MPTYEIIIYLRQTSLQQIGVLLYLAREENTWRNYINLRKKKQNDINVVEWGVGLWNNVVEYMRNKIEGKRNYRNFCIYMI